MNDKNFCFCDHELNRRQIVKATASSILFVFCTYFTVKIAIDFFSDPVAVKITELVENEIYLPEIMICPMDPLNITKLRLDGYPDEAISAFHWHFVQDLYNHIGSSELDFNKTFEIPNVTRFVAREDWATFVKTYGLSCPSFLAYCSFYNKWFNCCSTAQPVLHEKQGVCYKFPKDTYPGSSKVERSGGNSALVLIINVPDFNHSNINLVPLESGAMLEYGYELKPPFTYGSHAYVRLPINFSTEIGLYRTYHDRIFNSNDPCSNEELKCRLDCLNDGMQEFCNCSLLGFSNDSFENSSMHVCNPLDVPKCFSNPAFGDYYNQNCAHMQCLVPCQEWVHYATVTFGNLNPKLWEVYEGNPPLSKNVIKVRVFYDSLRYEEVKEFNLINFDTVLSQLGGIVGLWLGVSVYSIIKAIDKAWRWHERRTERVKPSVDKN